MGSVPKILQFILRIPKDKYLLSFINHDSAWEHGGIWYCPPGCELYGFVPMSLYATNRMLAEMIPAEGEMDDRIGDFEAKRDAFLVRFGVDIAAAWRNVKGRKARFPRDKQE
jgi:hypothetical protein